MAQYLLPDETRNALTGANLNLQELNLSLLSNLYLKVWTETAGNWEITTDSKEGGFNAMKSVYQNPFLESVRNRAEASLGGFKQKKSFSLKTSWRMVVGLGAPNPLESSMTLHPVYGFPYIPATAVKGIARAWAEKHAPITPADRKQILLEIFGSEDKYSKDSENQQVGGIIFFDALPNGFPKFEIDVMTPHYSQYYTKGEVPGDWYSPVPIKFLTVDTGSEFTFSLAASRRLDSSRSDELLNHAAAFLEEGLVNLGVGAKSNAGYGYFLDQSGKPSSAAGSSVEPDIFRGQLTREAQVPAHVVRSDAGKITVRLHTETPNEATFTYAAGIQVGKWVWVKVTNPKSLSVQFIKFI